MFDVSEAKKRLEAKYNLRNSQLSKKRKQIILTLKDRVSEITDRFPSIQSIYIFGSIANPLFFHELSDIDIAVQGLHYKDELRLAIHLENILKIEQIDLIMMEDADKDLIKKIKSGILIYAKEV